MNDISLHTKRTLSCKPCLSQKLILLFLLHGNNCLHGMYQPRSSEFLANTRWLSPYYYSSYIRFQHNNHGMQQSHRFREVNQTLSSPFERLTNWLYIFLVLPHSHMILVFYSAEVIISSSVPCASAWAYPKIGLFL